MKKKLVDFYECINLVNRNLEKGIFLTTKFDEKVNTMSIGWGQVGIIWERPMFIAFVRENRYTRELLDKNPEFTVNVPVGEYDNKIFEICGTKSGRDIDKVKEAGLNLVSSDLISVPAIRELPLTLECKVIYREKINNLLLPEDIRKGFYSVESESHIAYYGHILSWYELTD